MSQHIYAILDSASLSSVFSDPPAPLLELLKHLSMRLSRQGNRRFHRSSGQSKPAT